MISLRCFLKIFAVVVIASLVIFKLNEFSERSKKFFLEKNEIVKSIDEVKHHELMLNYTVSASSLYLYKNNDTIIRSIDALNSSIEKLLHNKAFEKSYPSIYEDIVAYKKLIDKKEEYVYEFQSYNSAIKNSTMYLTMLLKQFSSTSTPKPKLYKKHFVEAISIIFLSKNSIDKELVKNIDVNYFKNVKLKNKKLNRLNKMFTAHLQIFQTYYPRYNTLLIKILDSKTKNVLNNVDADIYRVANKKLEGIEYALTFLMGFILLFTLFVIGLIIKSERENVELNKLTNKLQETIRIDNLTELANRYKFDEDLQKEKHFGFYLINIDKFKYINNYYGTKIGDKLLQKVASILESIVKKNASLKLYRLDADNFGILLLERELLGLEGQVFKHFEKHEIDVGEFQFKISVSVAYSNITPYLENASIALKRVKKSSRVKFLVYSQSIDNKEHILQNILKTKTLYCALGSKQLVPYFQAIIDVKTEKVAKYEVLSRIIRDDGRAESIYPYLQIAKDNKLYSQITKTILHCSVKLFSTNKMPFNINFSIEDIMDESIMSLLNVIKEKEPEVMKQITFEILESESINDYNVIKNFITTVKSMGSKVAIDDFGSGYSNFEHLINLDIDYIKIDGSLIKNIHIDKNAYNIVNLINQFAHQSGIETVAEFVENREIYLTLKELGVDYAQGYYFAKPEKNIETKLS